MRVATTSKRHGGNTKLLTLSKEKIDHRYVRDLKNILRPGDLLVVNNSAVLPSSFQGKLERTNEQIEIRLAAFQGEGSDDLRQWRAVSFGGGDWTDKTEDRGMPPVLKKKDRIFFGSGLTGIVQSVEHDRFLFLEFISDDLHKNLYRYGRPIQYSYLDDVLDVWDQQTIFAGVPLSVEPPSSAFPLTWKTLLELKEQGVKIAWLTHAAGLSSAGDIILDQYFPLPEKYDIPNKTAQEITDVKSKGARVIAVGTTVVRALETASGQNGVLSGAGVSDLKITPNYSFKTVDGMITGLHDDGTSHMDILRAFAPDDMLDEAYQQAQLRGYRSHEYGDIMFLEKASQTSCNLL